VLDGDPAFPPQKGSTAAPTFGPTHIYCGQTAAPAKGAQPPIFGLYPL